MSHADHDVIAAARDGDLMDDVSAFFAPTSTDMVDGLVAGYRQDRARIEAAQIGPDDVCLEPSAGTGGLADLMPKDRTLCVEISPLHCKVLEAKGHSVTCLDFLKVQRCMVKPDRIVMNPPFSEGRWQAHLEYAAGLLADGGRLVAILPASAKGKDVLPGWACEWSRTYDNEFAGTSVSVVILTAVRG